ncbi:hypothetical protein K2X30_10360 [bacterium]|jgi:hypothetical protein|nr:hypothetical protein [bacterium]
MKPENEKKYEEKMMRFSQLYHLYRGDFDYLTVEEFETWKGSRGLVEEERTLWLQRRRELEIISKILLEAYKDGKLAFKGKASFLEILHENLGDKDHALFGRVIKTALDITPSKGRGRSSHPDGLRRLMRSLMDFFKIEHPAKSYDERIEMLIVRFHELGLKKLIPTKETVLELLRMPRNKLLPGGK